MRAVLFALSTRRIAPSPSTAHFSQEEEPMTERIEKTTTETEETVVERTPEQDDVEQPKEEEAEQ